MADAKSFKQDMPPKGGYGAINWAKVPGKKRFGGYATFAIAGGITVLGWIGYYYERAYKRRIELEMNDGRIALAPLLMAEEHRMYLKQLRTNRDEENELMKNVPGWETGKWKGEPTYNNPNNRFPVVHPEAYYAHTAPYDMFDRYFERRKH